MAFSGPVRSPAPRLAAVGWTHQIPHPQATSPLGHAFSLCGPRLPGLEWVVWKETLFSFVEEGPGGPVALRAGTLSVNPGEHDVAHTVFPGEGRGSTPGDTTSSGEELLVCSAHSL